MKNKVVNIIICSLACLMTCLTSCKEETPVVSDMFKPKLVSGYPEVVDLNQVKLIWYKVNAARKSKVDDNTAKMQSIKWLGV